MSFVVVGANGRLGSRLVSYLTSKGERVEVVSACAILKNGHRSMFSELSKISDDKVVVINCAAYTDMVRYSLNHGLAYSLNVTLPSFLLKLALQAPQKFKIVQISTDAMYYAGNSSEDSVILAKDLYSNHKIQAENHILKLEDSLVIRANFYGKSLTAPTYTDYLIERLKSGATLKVRDHVFSPIPLYAMVRLIQLFARIPATGLLNVGGRNTTKLDIAKILVGSQSIFQNQGPLLLRDEESLRSSDTSMCMDKLKGLICTHGIQADYLDYDHSEHIRNEHKDFFHNTF